MTSSRSQNPLASASRRARAVVVGAFVAGLALSGVLVASTWLPASAGTLGAELRVSAAPTGELDVFPVGRPVLVARDLKPGASARGRLRVGNITGRSLRLRVGARTGEAKLGPAVRVEIRHGGRRVAAGPATGRLKGPGLRIAAGERKSLEVVISLSSGRTPTAGTYAEVALAPRGS